MNSINSKLKDTLRFRIALLLGSMVLIILREPALLLHPRLWAEEGCIFYQHALHHNYWDIFTTAHVGYLTLFNSIVSVLQAKVFSVENAAAVSTYLGFLVQLIPVCIIIFTTHTFWDTAFKKIICVFITIIVMSPEIWLNTTNSHFIFGLVTFLILLISTSIISSLQKYLFRILLIIGGLTGPASILFTPMFLFKAYREKSKENYIQASIISICAVAQAIVIVYAIVYNNTYQRLSTYSLRHTLFSFFGDNFSMFPHNYGSYANPTIFYLCLFLGITMAAYYIYFLIKTRKDNDCLISLLSLLIVGSFSTLGSLNMAGSPRYAYIPTCIFMLVITSQAFKIKKYTNKTKYLALFVLILALTLNTVYYRHGMANVYSPTFPKWADEVAKWRVDSTYNPQVHPSKEWKVKL